MDQNKKTLKEDIEKAEKNILIVSWLGIFSTIVFIVNTLVSA